MEGDAAARVLQKSLHRLASVLEPVPLATALYSAEIIEERTWEEARTEGGSSYDKNLKVIGAVKRGVKAKPECFDQFCSILEAQAVTKDLAKKLKGNYWKLEQQAPRIRLVTQHPIKYCRVYRSVSLLCTHPLQYWLHQRSL